MTFLCSVGLALGVRQPLMLLIRCNALSNFHRVVLWEEQSQARCGETARRRATCAQSLLSLSAWNLMWSSTNV